MADHSAGHGFLPHSRGDDELQTHPESSAMEPQEECNPQGFTSHSAFTNESELSYSALTNEPEPLLSAFTNESEPTQSQDHSDAMIDSENTAGRRANYERCQDCLRTHLPPCNAPQEDNDLLLRDPEAYKRKFNTDRKKRNRKNRSAREPPPPVCGHSRVSRPAHANAARPGAPAGRQNRPLPYPDLPSAEPRARQTLTHIANTAAPDEVARIRALLTPNSTGPEDQTTANMSRLFEDQLAQIAGGATEAEPAQE